MYCVTQCLSPSISEADSIIMTENADLSAQVTTEELTTRMSSLHSMTTQSRNGIHKLNPRHALFSLKTLYSLPKTVAEALNHLGLRQAMLEELDSIYQNHTWSLKPTTAEMNILGCRWVFTIKLMQMAHSTNSKHVSLQKDSIKNLGSISTRHTALSFKHLQFRLFS